MPDELRGQRKDQSSARELLIFLYGKYQGRGYRDLRHVFRQTEIRRQNHRKIEDHQSWSESADHLMHDTTQYEKLKA